jgi:hypothetical protein
MLFYLSTVTIPTPDCAIVIVFQRVMRTKSLNKSTENKAIKLHTIAIISNVCNRVVHS